jgi:hypothetical protein
MSSRLLCTRSRGSRWAGQIPSLTTVAYRQDGDQVSLIAVEGYISGVAKPDEPLTKAGRHRPGLPAEFGMCAQQFHTLTDCLKGAPGDVAAIRRQEIVQSCDVVQRRGCPDHPRHRSTMRLRRLRILACFETREPRVGLGCRGIRQRLAHLVVPHSARWAFSLNAEEVATCTSEPSASSRALPLSRE